jgi:hypothetical protein
MLFPSRCFPIAPLIHRVRFSSIKLLRTLRSTGPAIAPSVGICMFVAWILSSRGKAWDSFWHSGECRKRRKREKVWLLVYFVEKRIVAFTRKRGWGCRLVEVRMTLRCLVGDVSIFIHFPISMFRATLDCCAASLMNTIYSNTLPTWSSCQERSLLGRVINIIIHLNVAPRTLSHA